MRTPTVSGMTMVQGTFDDLGTPLSTSPSSSSTSRRPAAARPSAASPRSARSRCAAARSLGEFQTLVNPGAPIPPFISVLTGITDAMVAGAPRIEAALPAFLEFAAGTRARGAQRRLRHRLPQGARPRRTEHDVARLPGARHRAPRPPARAPRRGAQPPARHPGPPLPGHDDPRPPGPARRPGDRRRPARPPRAGRLARGALARGAARLHRRGSPRARAASATSPTTCPTRRASTSSRTGRATSSTSARRSRSAPACAPTSRPPSTAAGWARWSRIAESVSPIVCATTLEAEVRELRLIAEHKPRYNRRSRNPEKAPVGQAHRRAVPPAVHRARRSRDDGARYAGPFGSRTAAEAAIAAVHEVLPLRQCTRAALAGEAALGLRPRRDGPLRRAVHRRPVRRRLRRRRRRAPPSCSPATPATCSTAAARADGDAQRRRSGSRTPQIVRDRLVALVRGTSRSQRLDALARMPRARRRPPRRSSAAGRSSASATAASPAAPRRPRGADPMPYVAALLRQRRGRRPARRRRCRPRRPRRARSVLRWLESPGVRIVEVDGAWTCPVRRCRAASAPSSSRSRRPGARSRGFAGVR